jgi:hypothetical protein
MTRARDVADTQDNLGGAVAPFVGAKNRIINGDFSQWQRGVTFGPVSNFGYYGPDRWNMEQYSAAGQPTNTQQTFTPGAAPVAGYEGKFFLRQSVPSTSDQNAYAAITQKIEDVRTFAGQTVTLSFWAKAGSGTPSIILETTQDFGSGGSAAAKVFTLATFVLSTSWTRYTKTFSVASLAGKTIGVNDNFALTFWTSGGSTYGSRMPGLQTNSFDFWGFQLEAGSVATPFTTASGSIGGELAMCQRYYSRFTAGDSYSAFTTGIGRSTTAFDAVMYFPVQMRVKPTSLDFSTLASVQNYSLGAVAVTALAINTNSPTQASLVATVGSSVLLAGTSYFLTANNSTSAYIGFSAEL